MMNLLKQSINSEKKKSVLVERIKNTCDDLSESLTMKPHEAINQYGEKIVLKLDSEFIDTIAIQLLKLKNQLKDLAHYIKTHENLGGEEIESIFTGCNNIISKTIEITKKDNLFMDLLAIPCLEIKNLAKKIKHSIVLPLQMTA